jgi:uncharacterized lipoprotein YmbA
MTMPRFPLVAIMLVGLCGCGTSPPAHYYALDEPPAMSVAKTGSAIVLFGPFEIAQYLQRPQIIVRDANQKLKLAEFDRWAVAPQLALVPWLARDIDAQLVNAVVVAFPSVGHADAPFRVRGTIAQWDTDAAGTAVLVVQWECVTDNEVVLIPLRTSRYTAAVSKTANYGDIVAALNQTLADFAKDVATQLASAIPAPSA